MLKTPKLIVVAAGLLGLAAASVAARLQSPGRVALEEVLSLGGADSADLLQWTGVAADRDGSIFVLHALDCARKKFDDKGRLVGRTGRKGQGPGEFQFPVLLALSGERLYAADQRRLGLQVFDRGLRFLRTIASTELVTAVAADGRGGVAYKPFTGLGQAARWRICDETGAVSSETVYMDKIDVYLADSISLAFGPDGSVYTAYLYRDLIEKRDGRGRLAWSRMPRGGRESAAETIQGLKIAKSMFWMDAALDPQGRLYVLAGGKTEHPARDVLVYDPEGTLLTSFVLPQTSHMLHIDGRGCLYVRAEEGVTLKKYRVRFL